MSKFIYINPAANNADDSVSFPAEKLYALRLTSANNLTVFWQDSKRTGLNKCILPITSGKGYEVIDSIVSAINFGKNNLITLIDDETGVKISEDILSAGDVTFEGAFVLTGNVTGNLTGNSAGVHTGAVAGNVTGDLIGDVIHTSSITNYAAGAGVMTPGALLPDSIHSHINEGAVTFTLPAGGALDSAITETAWPIGSYREMIYANIGTGASTITGTTGMTVVGNASVATLTNVRIAVYKVSASAYTAYVL